MNNMNSLSRLNITGMVTPSTPLVVLREIAEAHSISYDETKLYQPRYLTKIINCINTAKVNTVTEPYDKDDYRKIARFVNRNYCWTKRTLLQAFNFILNYNDIEKLREIHIDFNFGSSSPQKPNNLNACILYGICKVNRIETRSDTTMDEMACNIELLFRLRDPTIQHSIRETVHNTIIYGDCDGYQLVNILSTLDPDKSVHIINEANSTNQEIGRINNRYSDSLNNNITYNRLNTAGELLRETTVRRHPHSHVEAVAMAAIHYKIDISKVDNPLAEYQELIRTPYLPIDRNLARRLGEANKHPDSLRNPKLNVIFNPELPDSLYDLVDMCLAEGYNQMEIEREGAYTILQTTCFIPTFYHGKQGNIINDETTMLDELEEVEYDSVIVYGIRNQPMRFYTYGEIYDNFNHYNRFQRPDGDNLLFTETEINKLSMLCKAEPKYGESPESFNMRRQLYHKIDQVKLYQQTNQEQVRQFVDKYNSYHRPDQNKIVRVFKDLLHSGMYMRGWTGEGPYTLSAESTNTSYDQQHNIDLRVTESIITLETNIEGLAEIDPSLPILFRELPLMFYNSTSGNLLPSTVMEEGLTIYDRINIVKGGEDGSIQSCIRMSSNRFLSSAYYYLQILGREPGFNMAEVARIS